MNYFRENSEEAHILIQHFVISYPSWFSGWFHCPTVGTSSHCYMPVFFAKEYNSL